MPLVAPTPRRSQPRQRARRRCSTTGRTRWSARAAEAAWCEPARATRAATAGRTPVVARCRTHGSVTRSDTRESEKRHRSVSSSERKAFGKGRRDAPFPSVARVVIVLGVNCSTHCAFLAVAVDGALREGHVEYVDA